MGAERIKYPRTWHLPWSPGVASDDKIVQDLSVLCSSADVVVTVKQDGENTTMYSDYVHSRSTTYSQHPSRDHLRALHASVCRDIPEGWRICGENLYARHSIAYSNLSAYFQVFSVWDSDNVSLGWDLVCEWAALLGLQTVPVLYRGGWDEAYMRTLAPVEYQGDPCEGYVVRVAGGFHYSQFGTHMAKYVRAGHVQTDTHWMSAAVVPNAVRKD